MTARRAPRGAQAPGFSGRAADGGLPAGARGRAMAFAAAGLAGAGLLLAVGSSLAFPGAAWKSVEVHAVLEAAGSTAGLFLACFLALGAGADRPGPRPASPAAGRDDLLLAAGFMAMGVLDLAHAASSPGHGFVRLHTAAGVAGGLFFAALWLPETWLRAALPAPGGRLERAAGLSAPGLLAAAAASAAVLAGAIALFHDFLPAFVIAGRFTAWAKAFNAAAGLLFAAGAAAALRRMSPAAGPAGGAVAGPLFACMAGLLAASYLAFPASRLWDPGWWSWHLLRAAAFVLAAAHVLGSHARALAGTRSAMEEVRALNEGLERRVALRTRELSELNRELEAFSYSVSHDLRAPLRVIDGFAGVLQEDHAGRLDPEGMRVLGVVRANVRRMGALIDDLLAFSMVTRRGLAGARVDMTELARRVLADLLPAFPGPRPRTEVAALPPAFGDQALLRQVFANLIGNALKFSSGKPEPAVVVGAELSDGAAVYFVKDNGAGFDMRYSDKLFGVFQRLHRAEEFAGTGVGLAMAQRIIARHGGRIWAEGEVGKGAVFRFTLPGSQEVSW